MMYLLFIFNLFVSQAYTVTCNSSVDILVKSMNEKTIDSKIIDMDLKDTIFTKARTHSLIENGEVLLKHGESFHTNMFQSKGTNHDVEILYTKSDFGFDSMLILLKHVPSQRVSSFDLRFLVKNGNLKNVKTLKYLGTGGSGSVFKVEYKDGTRETLKLYHSYSGDAIKARVDFTEERMLYLIFGQDKKQKIGISNYTMLRDRDVVVTVIDDKGQSKIIHGKVIKVETLKSGNILNNIKRQLSAKQQDIIVRKFKTFLSNIDIKYFIKRSEGHFIATENFKNEFFSIPGIQKYLSYNKYYNDKSLIERMELEIICYARNNNGVYSLASKRMFSVILSMYGYDGKVVKIDSLVELFNIFLTEDGILRVIDPN